MNKLQDKFEVRRLRLQQLRDELCNGKNVALAEKIGREPSYVSRMLYPEGKEGKRRIGDDMIEVIERAFRLPAGWLNGYIDSILSNTNSGPEIRRAPLLKWDQLKTWQEFVKNFSSNRDEDWMPCPQKFSENTFASQVRGVSMEPRYSDEDIIFIDPDLVPLHGNNVIAKIDNETLFRNLIIEGDKKFLRPLNPDWPEQKLIPVDQASIIGVVSGKFCYELTN